MRRVSWIPMLTGAALMILATHQGGAEIPPEQVLATHDGGEVTLADVRARWLISGFPADGLEAQLSSLSDLASGERQALLGALAGEVREAALDQICLRAAENEGWNDDPALLHRVRSRIVQACLPLLTERMIMELPSPSPGELADLLAEYNTLMGRPERREARTIVLPLDDSLSDAGGDLQSRADEVLQRLASGEDFGLLAGELSEGPGWSSGGRLGHMSHDQAPWAELGSAVFSADPEGSPSLFMGESAAYITVVDRVVPGIEPDPQDVWRGAEAQWRRDRAPEVRQRFIDESMAAIGPRVHPEASSPHDIFLTVGEESLTLEEFRGLYPDRPPEELRQLAWDFAEIEVIARSLMRAWPAQEMQARLRATLAQEARRDWEQRLMADFHPSAGSVRAMYDRMVEGGTFPHHTLRHVILSRVMPQAIGETPTPDSLRRWRGLEAEARRIRDMLVEERTAMALVPFRIEDLDRSSPYAIEYLDMGNLSAPPTFLGQAFFEMEPGEFSPVIVARENVALIYGLVATDAVQPPPFESAAHLARNGVVAEEAASRLAEAIPNLIAEWNLQIAVDPGVE